MPEPQPLPAGVTATPGRSIPVLPSLSLPQRKTDMEFVDEFVEEWRKKHPRISWKAVMRKA